jgi:Tol biopolymer transport system component
MRTLIGLTLAALLFIAAPTAHAAFPGENGRIAYSFNSENEYEAAAVYSMNPDGTGKHEVSQFNPDFIGGISWSPDGKKIAFSNRTATIFTVNADGSDETPIDFSGGEGDPAWSPDGTRIAFQKGGDIYAMDPDGTNQTPTTTGAAFDAAPAWSPDGKKIAFECTRGPTGIWVMDANGANPVFIAPGSRPNWSPDGAKLAFARSGGSSQEIFVMNADGTNQVQLTNDAVADSDPAWSPDGKRLVFVHGIRIYTMNADGSSPAQIGTLDFGEESQSLPDWQPVLRGYIRPKSASPTYLSLVPAYEPCTAPNRTHGPPLAYDACAPPAPTSSQLTIGTADANGQPAKSMAYVRLQSLLGDPATPADEADLSLAAGATDVRNASDLSDYTGSLEARLPIRITDKDNAPYPGGPGPGTVTDTTFSFVVPCTATGDATVGSTCSIMTSAEATIPGAIKELKRTVWQVGRVEVRDGQSGSFLTQGLFIP